MPAFDFPPLAWWGLPLVAVPLVIHLINLLRYRRVRFAAMEFLLASQRKYRTRVLLRQMLLLALRTLAIAGVVLALAQPRWRSAAAGLFGRGGLQIVLLDDSLSMGERDGHATAKTAFERAKGVAGRIAATATGRGDTLVVASFSGLTAAEPAPLLPAQPASADTVQRGRDALARVATSWLACGPREPLDRVPTLAADLPVAGSTLWLVSDFRHHDWHDAESAAAVRRLSEMGVTIRLVDCGPDATASTASDATTTSNLTLVSMEAVGGVPATGVLVPVELEIRNDGPALVRDVQVELREDGASRAGLQIAEIPAGVSATRRFEVRFLQPGAHVVEARLPPDRLPADDGRLCVVDVVDHVDVLLVADDGADPRSGDAFYVATALAPGTAAGTGVRPRLERPAALAALDLAAYDCIWVLDVERLDPAAVDAIERHARAGGGVVFFCGPRTRADVVNRTLHREGQGLFPVPLAGAVEVLPGPGPGRVPDIVAEQHPVVTGLSGGRNPLLDAVRVDRVMAVARGFDEAAATGLQRLISLRDGGALMVEKPFGKGLVAAVLTTAAPTWNNWARGDPSWVVVMLELQSHLARQRRRAESLLVGDDVRIDLAAGSDENMVDFLVPPDAALVRQVAAPTDDGGFQVRLPTRLPGAYAARWRRRDGTEREQVAAVNVDAIEGRLERAGRERLARHLAGVPFRMDAADELDPAGGTLAGLPLARPLLVGLLVVLLLEQCVALAAGYHVAPSRRC
ncbi:MAG: hypothetical protein FJ284_09910 [Planctomycetes bacterium]|nr:hypothetical protein [Planctomycetota bacterium]